MTMETSSHVALRIPLATKVDGRDIDTVSAHNDIVSAKGAVVFAKFGAPLVPGTIKLLTDQIRRGTETALFLIGKKGRDFIGFKSRLHAIYQGELPNEAVPLIPYYYALIENRETKLWFVVDAPFVACDLAPLRLRSNKRPLLVVIGESRTPAMLVEFKP
jgi:hypothetical protein